MGEEGLGGGGGRGVGGDRGSAGSRVWSSLMGEEG